MNDDTKKRGNPAGNGCTHAEPIDDHANAGSDNVVESVVVAVSALTDTDPVELEPLHGVVNVDALEDLFAPKADGTPRLGGRVSFVYEGCEVTVHGTERVLVELHNAAGE